MAKPIKSYVQVVTLVIYSIAGVVIVAILLGRSPVAFLSGVGALAAVLMLVFRNTLLSLAASIQITSNDIIRIGDWATPGQAGRPHRAHQPGDVPVPTWKDTCGRHPKTHREMRSSTTFSQSCRIRPEGLPGTIGE